MSRNNELLIYAASAGSGKTFTLVNDYLSLILGQQGSFRQILAITFTNKATAEMKNRIISELDNLAAGKPSRHLEALLEKTGKSESELRERAAVCLRSILHDYSSFAVSTIDSYFQQLSATLGRELKLPLRFDIELNATRVMRDVAERVLDLAGADKNLTDWLLDLLFMRLDEGKGWKVRSELYRMTGQVMFNEYAHELAKTGGRDTIAELILTFRAIRKEVEDKMRAFGREALLATENYGFLPGDFPYPKQGGPFTYFDRIAHGKGEWKTYGDNKTRILKAVEEPSQFIKKEYKNDSTFHALVNEKLHPLLVQSMNWFKEHEKRYTGAVECLKLIHLAGITTVIDEQLKNFRTEKEIFLLSDTSRMLRQSIGDEDAPFIFEKSGITFRHIFIDEYQDTSTEQWEILRPLVKNSLGSGNKVLLVGDAKQSIYRWRGGNMHLILSGARNDLHRFASVTREQTLAKNWRSCGEIVRFNNAFFPKAASHLVVTHPVYTDAASLTDAYSEKHVQQESRPELDHKGYVEITYCSKDDSESWKEVCLKNLSVVLDKLKSDGYAPKDIAVLFRKNSEEQLIADHLLHEQKHPFLSSNSLLLHTHPAINYLLNCFRLSDGTSETIRILEIEEFAFERGLIDARPKGIQFGKNHTNDGNSWTETKLVPLLKSLQTLPLVLAASSLAEYAGYVTADPYIDAFMDILADYAITNGGGMGEFAAWWDLQLETSKFSIEIPETTDAVRLLTIHRSKGLEFPVVIIPFMDWDLMPDPRGVIWAHSDDEEFNTLDHFPLMTKLDLEHSPFADDFLRECRESFTDNLNMLYVAFTRAAERMYATGNKKSGSKCISNLVYETLTVSGHQPDIEYETETFRFGTASPLVKNNQIDHSDNSNDAVTVLPYSASTLKPFSAPTLSIRFESDEVRHGNLVHQILAASLTKQQAADEIARLSRIQPELNSAILTEAVNNIYSLMEEKGWLENTWTVIRETDFCDTEGNILRPDRVFMNDTKAVVVDFKTGKQDKAHNHQVQAYAEILRQTGFTEVETYLIYTSDVTLLSV